MRSDAVTEEPRAYRNVLVKNVGGLTRVGRQCPDRFGYIFADFVAIHVKGGNHADITNDVSAEVVVHESRPDTDGHVSSTCL